MNNHILKRINSTKTLPHNQFLDSGTDYELIRADYNSAAKEFGEVSSEKKTSLGVFLRERGVKDYRDTGLIPAKNFYLLKQESDKRQSSPTAVSLLPLDATTYHSEALSLLENMENAEIIRDFYRQSNFSLGDSKNSGISKDEARKIKYCFRQGRDLFCAGHEGASIVKPLNYFYALTAYAYGMIVTKNPLRNNIAQIPGSHGLDFINEEIYFRFGGDRKQGTFTDLHGAHTNTLIFAADSDFSIQRLDSIVNYHQHSATLSLGFLLSMVPEIANYYSMVTKTPSSCHPLSISRTGDRTSLAWEWNIGDGVCEPSLDGIKKAFPDCEVTKKYGKYIVAIANERLKLISPIVQVDARNNLWYTENPVFPICLNTLDIHFLITNALSNIMRYSPERWGEILLNEIDGKVSLIIQRYLASLESIFPLLVLREVSPYFPFINDGLTIKN